MQWLAGQSCLFAYGHAHGYLVMPEAAGVRLSRFSIARVASEETVAAIAEAARSVIIFPLGRGPGRPGGEPELTALTETAKAHAERFEVGEDLAFPGWQHASEPARAHADEYSGLGNPCPHPGGVFSPAFRCAYCAKRDQEAAAS